MAPPPAIPITAEELRDYPGVEFTGVSLTMPYLRAWLVHAGWSADGDFAFQPPPRHRKTLLGGPLHWIAAIELQLDWDTSETAPRTTAEDRLCARESSRFAISGRLQRAIHRYLTANDWRQVGTSSWQHTCASWLEMPGFAGIHHWTRALELQLSTDANIEACARIMAEGSRATRPGADPGAAREESALARPGAAREESAL